MANIATIHVVPADGGEWAVQAEGSRPSSVHPSRGLAVAKAWEMVEDRAEGEVIVHGKDGALHSNLLVRRLGSAPVEDDFLGEPEEAALRRQAMALTPNRFELDEMIGRMRPSLIDYSKEDDEPPC